MENSRRVGIVLKQIHDAIEKEVNNELQANDITFSQVQLLLALQTSENGTSTLKELEKTLGVAQSTTVGIVKRLEQKGFVNGGSAPDDKRIKVVKIAAKGEAICRNAKANMDEAEARFLHGLTQEEKCILHELLAKLYKNIKNKMR